MSSNLDNSNDHMGERAKGEARVRMIELCLVVMVAFGLAMFTSVYPLLGDVYGSGWFRDLYSPLYRALHVAISLTLLLYVLWRSGRSDNNTGSPNSQTGEIPLPPSQALGLAGRFKRVSRFEWCLVLLVASWVALHPLFHFWLRQVGWPPEALARNICEANMVVKMAIGLTILAYVLKRSGRTFRDIGLHWNGSGAALALPLFLFGRLCNLVQWPLVYWLGQTFSRPDWHPPDVAAMLHGNGVQMATVAGTLLVGFFEELIVRAYLMTEIMSLTQKAWLAIVVSVVVQTSYHFYQGVPLALAHVFMFTTFALFYARTRSILPVALAHSLVDLFADWNYGLREMFPY